MPQLTKKEYVQKLTERGRTQLAASVNKYWETSIGEYAAVLFAHSPSVPLDPELQLAFSKELSRLKYSSDDAEKITASLERTRVIQTAPHLGATESPRMLTIQWITSLGVPKNEYPVTGMFSGVPFSNSSRPGALNYSEHHTLTEIIDPKSAVYEQLAEKEKNRDRDSKNSYEKRITFFPSSEQDALVYRSTVQKGLVEIISATRPEIKALSSLPAAGQSYSQWALGFCNALERKILKREDLVHLDINEVITTYLLSVLDKPEHFVYKILFNADFQKKIIDAFGTETHLFYLPVTVGNKKSQETLHLAEGKLVGSNQSFELTPEVIRDLLINKNMCPGIFLLFTILSFINGFTCLGSFSQVEYLPAYGENWRQTGLLSEIGTPTPTLPPLNSLATGVWLENQHAYYPLDILLGSQWNPDPKTSFSTIIAPVLDELLARE